MPAIESIANEAATTLNGAILSGATSITVLSAAGFPAVPFRARISGNLTAGGTGIEYVTVTAVAGTTWTVTRATETPYNTALGFATGAKVENVVTAAGLYEAGPYVNVKSPRFGAKGDGSTDDAAAINAAIAYAATLGVTGGLGATVFFPPGLYMISAVLTLPGYVRLLGSGRYATTIKRSAGVVMISIYGTDSSTRNWYASVEQVALHGADYNATQLDCVYASQVLVRGVTMFGCTGRGIDLVEVWDSNFTDMFLEWVGGVATTTLPAIHVRNSRAASGFGFSTDNTNEVRFTNVHFEAFRAGAFRIEASQGSNEPNGVYITNIKMENHVISGTAPFIYVASEANRVHIRNVYAYAGGLLDGAAVNIIETASGKQCSIRDVFVGCTTGTATVANGVYVNVSGTSTGLTVVDSIYGQYSTAPTGAHVNVNSAAALVVTNIRSNTGTLLTGYEIDAATRRKALTADITTTSTTAVNISGSVGADLTFTNVQPGTYQVDFIGMYRCSVTTARLMLGVGGTATATATGQVSINNSTTALFVTEITAINTTFNASASNAAVAATSYAAQLTATVVVTVVGTVGIRWNTSSAATMTMRSGSAATMTRIR